MRNVCVEISVPIEICFELDDAVDFDDDEAVLEAAKNMAQSADDDGELDIRYDDEDNGITLISKTITSEEE